MLRATVALALFLVVFTPLAAQDAPPDQQERMRAMTQARQVAMAVMIYSSQHAGLPPDFQTMVDQGILPDEGSVAEDGVAWVAGGVTFGYLGIEGVQLGDVPDWGNMAIAHRSLARPFLIGPTPDNPDGTVVPVAFLDGHVEMVSLDEARWLLEDARTTFAALAGQGAMPAYRQLELDAGRLAQAMLAYANAHEGRAPTDWAGVFAFLPESRWQPDETQADRLRLFLMPKARATTFIPDFDDALERDQWINANSMWRTTAAGADLRRVPIPTNTVLVHSRPDAWIEAPDRRKRAHVRRLASATVDGMSALSDRGVLAERVRGSEAVFDAIRGGGPLPPLDDAIHDLNALSNAIHAYARDNDGFLPRDLGEVLPYLDGLKGVYEQQPGRIFLTRHHEAGHDMDEAIDPNWILENTSYTYLGDGRVRLQELRHAYVGLLLHGPIAEPLAWTTTDAVGQPIEVVPYAPPMFARVLPTSAPSTHAYALPAETVALMATDSRNAIKRAAGDE